MIACWGNLSRMTREELLRVASGLDGHEECEATGAALILALMDKDNGKHELEPAKSEE